MVVAAAMMVVADGTVAIDIPVAGVGLAVGDVVRRDMDVGAMMIVVVGRFDERDRRPVGDVGHRVLGLRHPMQVHRRQNGDAKTDAELAEGVRHR
ncbi:hypothetical protein [Brevundimonas sp.]|uniref:hypothetical protein n=1 Tax=Brevundimonas sp. TaxID=1871086 RepID=UPI00261D170F|nr:hypothetical protein [Brevundimonas sp.]